MNTIFHPSRPLGVLSLLCAVLLACTSCFENDDPVDKAGAISNVNGTWRGTTTNGDTVILDLNQAVLSIDVTGSARIGSLTGPLSGSIDGDRFEATIQSQPPRRIFATEANGSMSGTVREIGANILDNFNAQLQ